MLLLIQVPRHQAHEKNLVTFEYRSSRFSIEGLDKEQTPFLDHDETFCLGQ